MKTKETLHQILFKIVQSRDAEPEPEPEPEPPEPEPLKRFARSRSRSRSRKKRGGSGSENGYNCGKLTNVNSEITNSRTNRLPVFFINNFKTSAMSYLKFSSLPEACILYYLNIKEVLYQVRSCH